MSTYRIIPASGMWEGWLVLQKKRILGWRDMKKHSVYIWGIQEAKEKLQKYKEFLEQLDKENAG